MIGIYRIIIRRPGKPSLFYIGQASSFAKRRGQHLRRLRSGGHENIRLSALFAKYGESSFAFEMVVVCRLRDLLFYEQAVLDFYVAAHGKCVLNICRRCVRTSIGVKRTAASRAKMSAAKKGLPGRKWTEEQKARLSEKKKGWMPSPQTVAAIILANTGRYPSEETRSKMSKAQRGRKDSPETRELKRVGALHRWGSAIVERADSR